MMRSRCLLRSGIGVLILQLIFIPASFSIDIEPAFDEILKEPPAVEIPADSFSPESETEEDFPALETSTDFLVEDRPLSAVRLEEGEMLSWDQTPWGDAFFMEVVLKVAIRLATFFGSVHEIDAAESRSILANVTEEKNSNERNGSSSITMAELFAANDDTQKSSLWMDPYIQEVIDLIIRGKIPAGLVRDDVEAEQIADYIFKQYAYERDRSQFGKEDYWQSPGEFVKSRKGDCEDFALLTHALLKLNGFNSMILNIYGDASAHSVVVFEDDGLLSVIDTGKLRRFRAASFEELLYKINPYWTQGAVISKSPRRDHGVILKTFRRTSQGKMDRLAKKLSGESSRALSPSRVLTLREPSP